MKKRVKAVKGSVVRAAEWVRRHLFGSRLRSFISGIAIVTILVVIAQLFYPANRLPLLASVDSLTLGGLTKDEAVQGLDDAYAQVEVPIFVSSNMDTPATSPHYTDLGITIYNTERIDAYDYSWYWRLVPTSLLWHHTVVTDNGPSIQKDDQQLVNYITNQFGEDCQSDPINATIAPTDGVLQVVAAQPGGSCDRDELIALLNNLEIRLNPNVITVTGETIPPNITTQMAEAERDRMTTQLTKGVTLTINGDQTTVPEELLIEWIQYSENDGKLAVGLDAEKASEWLTSAFGGQLLVAPGTTTITTHDFTELSRQTGKSGQALDTAATIQEMLGIMRGEKEAGTVLARVVPPNVTYKRSYSPTDAGLSAMIKNYAETHPGVYGVKLIELSGARRHASYNADKQFTTASTYKLFVAYSTLLRIESGAWKWTDHVVGGRDVSRCFDDMIKLSDNPCAEALLYKINFRPITDEARAIGAVNTSFLGNDGVKSTAADEALLLSLLYTGQILSQQSSRDRFINALRGNVHRNGIPAGLPSIVVANKPGFLDALLHDAAIVYSPSGTYVLVILTERSSWANIAELTRQIEALRNGV